MTQGLDLDSSTRLLVVVPHPDDETLATGTFIQHALTAGASLRVVIATDGDDNPWPQRWIERRWHIDPQARRRWGKRRREEASEALARLGVAGPDARHYGWPDQGLTGRLMRDAQCEDQLAAEIQEFAPTLIVAPSLADVHPDHNALRVMIELAMARTPPADCRRLGFVVHGPTKNGESLTVPADDDQAWKKQFSLQAHTSQLVLSSRRMNEICRRVERFETFVEVSTAAPAAGSLEWQMADSRPAIPLRERVLYLIARIGERVIRTSLPLPGKESSSLDIELKGEGALHLELTKIGNQIHVRLSSELVIDQCFAKIERLGSRVLIYDANGWQRIL